MSSPHHLGLPEDASAPQVLGAIAALLPAPATVWRGWGYLSRRFGIVEGDGTIADGSLTNFAYLLDPDTECRRFEPLPSPPPRTP